MKTKTRIIRLAIGLTALVASFLPQKAQAGCGADCLLGSCYGDKAVKCGCTWYGTPYCNPPAA